MNRIFLSGLLIVAGLVFLLANLGLISPPPFRMVLGLWPLLLVVWGVERLLARRNPQLALGLQTAAVALGVALLALQPLTRVTDRSDAIAGAPEVVITATDFRFAPDQVMLPADVVNLTFRNDGVLHHDLTIPSLRVQLTAKSGEAVTVGLRDLPRGVHDAYCSVDGHDDAGMRMTVRVD